MVDIAIRDKKTVEQLKLDIQSMCIKCLKNAEEIKDCEICNWHTSIQLEINFK